ncbi:hypothetical protein CALVIDRAFT_90822 [Calocera viscosa TUFC12733]|uniref:Uncharacterized protein n=1 Tax=Calocera viscosa (strain TUFC12733) TaxID=1330018 RepID=A0A167MSM1_CALVF|nr:hypothetical protein CALVIDRAFT_90822 [Calocera viscosa TUFC12733]
MCICLQQPSVRDVMVECHGFKYKPIWLVYYVLRSKDVDSTVRDTQSWAVPSSHGSCTYSAERRLVLPVQSTSGHAIQRNAHLYYWHLQTLLSRIGIGMEEAALRHSRAPHSSASAPLVFTLTLDHSCVVLSSARPASACMLTLTFPARRIVEPGIPQPRHDRHAQLSLGIHVPCSPGPRLIITHRSCPGHSCVLHSWAGHDWHVQSTPTIPLHCIP